MEHSDLNAKMCLPENLQSPLFIAGEFLFTHFSTENHSQQHRRNIIAIQISCMIHHAAEKFKK